MELVCLDSLVPKNHPYRAFYNCINFELAMVPLKELSNNTGKGADGYDIKQHFKFLLLQFLEDNSDRQHERFIAENVAARWFCGLRLTDKTPDHTTLCKKRKQIGTKRLSRVFHLIRKQLKKKGLISEVFTFIDSSKLISKNNLWLERDKALDQKIEVFNNEMLPKVAIDKQAKIGCKGKKQYWFGYKQHVSVDMQSGLINKIAISPANETDGKGLKRVCPNGGAVYADKGYCGKTARQTIKAKGCHDATLKNNNMKIKNKDLDRWHSKLRSPYERVFSKMRHHNGRVRYRGIAKNQFASYMGAICHNLKRIIVLTS